MDTYLRDSACKPLGLMLDYCKYQHTSTSKSNPDLFKHDKQKVRQTYSKTKYTTGFIVEYSFELNWLKWYFPIK